MSEVKTEYGGVEVSYVERENHWEFELRGRLRNAPSLAKAKEFIDREPKEKRKPFERFECYYSSYSGEPRLVTVTSYAGRGYSGHEFWIINSRGSREKVRASSLYLVNAANDQKLAEIKALDGQCEQIRQKQNAITESLETAKPPEGADQ